MSIDPKFLSGPSKAFRDVSDALIPRRQFHDVFIMHTSTKSSNRLLGQPVNENKPRFCQGGNNYDQPRRPICLFGDGQKITECKKLEAEVAVREQQLNTFFTDAPAGLVLLDKDLRYVRLNNRVAEINGVPLKDHLGKTVREVLPRFAPVVEPLLQQVLATGKPILNMELSGEKPDRLGMLQHLMESFFPILGKDGKTEGIGVILVDITEHRRAEEALKKAEDHLRFLLDTTPAIIHTARPDGYLDYFNQHSLDYMGLPREALLGWGWMAIIHPEDVAGEVSRWRAHVASGEPFEHEARVRRADGKYRWALHRMVAMRDEQGKIIKWCGTGMDIDDRKQAEQSLQASHARLRALSTRLQSVREEEAIRIAREIHDDLGQQMTGLKLDLARAERKLERMESSPAVNLLLDTVVSASELADNITARVQEIAANLRPEMLDKLGLSAALHYESRRFQERTGVLCEARLPETEPQLSTEVSTALFRIFQECLTNVARHALASKVEAGLEWEEGWVGLRVRDDGRGITEAEIANPESLGLLGMKERTALLGGEIVFARHPEGGTIVLVRIPPCGTPVQANIQP
jgi:PAS domain S-box-containing protein